MYKHSLQLYLVDFWLPLVGAALPLPEGCSLLGMLRKHTVSFKVKGLLSARPGSQSQISFPLATDLWTLGNSWDFFFSYSNMGRIAPASQSHCKGFY